MLRELAEAIEVLSSVQPLVLVLEDLHWSDVSTLDWLVYMAQRRDPARLLILGTYRPIEAITHSHPIHKAAQELQLRGRSCGLALDYLPQADVNTYLQQRFGNVSQRDQLAQILYQRTTGNPLFIVTIADELVRHGQLQLTSTGWILADDIDTMMSNFPESLKLLLEQQVIQLDLQDQELLEVASVVGSDFTSAAVTTCVDLQMAEVESRCEALVKKGQFLIDRGLVTWPDGTLTARYGFVHVLYQEIFYARIAISQCLRYHQSIGERLEKGFGERAPEISAELALHFQRGRDTERAVKYLHTSGDIAARRYAHPEAITQFTKALAILASLPDTIQRTHQEFELRMSLGPALMATKGHASPDVEHLYIRARELGQQRGEILGHFPVVWGLWRFYYNQGKVRTARELSEQLLTLAKGSRDETLLLAAHVAHGTSLYFLGDFIAAQTYLEQHLITPSHEVHQTLAMRYGIAPGVQGHAFLAQTLWALGYPQHALQQSQHACQLAQELAHPPSVGLALYYAVRLQLKRRETLACHHQVKALISFAAEHELPHWEALGGCQEGWVLAMQGQHKTGMEKTREGLTKVLEMGIQLAKQVFIIALVECMQTAEDAIEGLALIRQEEKLIDETGQHYLEAELYRLKGRLLLQQTHSDMSQAEVMFNKALQVARQQKAKSWELRVALSLSRLWQQQNRQEEARNLLVPIYSWFTEGLDTSDLVEAKGLLAELGV